MGHAVNGAIQNLLRGISTDDVETVRDAWRAALADRGAALEAILAKLAAPVWDTYPRGPLRKYLGILLALLDEIDPEQFRSEIARLQRGPIHPLHAKTVDLLAARASDQPIGHVGPGIPVYVAGDVREPRLVLSDLERWSGTKGLGLADVTRIDVIARTSGMDYLGRYNLFFSGIILTWPAGRARGLRLLWRRIRAELTFYHEVGHHALGHKEGGQVEEQECEANDYARRMFRRAHPVLIAIGQVFLLPLKLAAKLLARNAVRSDSRPHDAA